MRRSLARPRQSKQQDKLLAGNQSLNILTFNNNIDPRSTYIICWCRKREKTEEGSLLDWLNCDCSDMMSVTVNVAIIER